MQTWAPRPEGFLRLCGQTPAIFRLLACTEDNLGLVLGVSLSEFDQIPWIWIPETLLLVPFEVTKG